MVEIRRIDIYDFKVIVDENTFLNLSVIADTGEFTIESALGVAIERGLLELLADAKEKET